MKYAVLAAALFASALGGCAATRPGAAATAPLHPEARLFDPAGDSAAEVARALQRARENSRNVLLVMGANWCHDSRAFAGWMQTPRFAAMAASRFEVVYIDVGNPQRGDARNLEIAQRFGIGEIVGTPTVLVVAPDAALLNRGSAGSWRNTASRSEDEIFAELAAFPLP
ncbi:thioredoxin family protein [Altererythrobacter aquiaggeris]|uniref:thioredoxin family protein n=1 Tax=Aestuarierythrobacter aquiaggeris TaxID=1898396 RepID=UPI003015CC9B